MDFISYWNFIYLIEVYIKNAFVWASYANRWCWYLNPKTFINTFGLFPPGKISLPSEFWPSHLKTA